MGMAARGGTIGQDDPEVPETQVLVAGGRALLSQPDAGAKAVSRQWRTVGAALLAAALAAAAVAAWTRRSADAPPVDSGPEPGTALLQAWEDLVDVEMSSEHSGDNLAHRLEGIDENLLLRKEFASFGGQTACRADLGDTTTDGRGTCKYPEGISSKEHCQAECEKDPACKGFEWGKQCELWTVQILHAWKVGSDPGPDGGFLSWTGGAGKCIGIDGGNNQKGTKVVVGACDNSAKLLFPDPGQQGSIKWAANPDKCLDVKDYATFNGNGIQIWSCSGGSSQVFTMPQQGVGTIRWSSHKDICLNNDGGRLTIWACGDGTHPNFQFQLPSTAHGEKVESKDTECLARVFAGTYKDLGSNTACRISEDDDSSDGYATTVVRQGYDAQMCKTLCRTVIGAMCTGVEINKDRCEMWTQPIGYQKSAGGYRCQSFEPSGYKIGRPFYIRSTQTLKCLASNFTMGSCNYGKGLSEQSWQIKLGRLLSASSDGNMCFDIKDDGKAVLRDCSHSAARWEHTRQGALRLTAGSASGKCLELAGGGATAKPCKEQIFEYVGYGESTACRLNVLDETPDGEGTTKRVAVSSLEECRSKCASDPFNCKGFNYVEAGAARRLKKTTSDAEPMRWSAHPEMCLNVAGGKAESGNPVQLSTCKDDDPNQQFVPPSGGKGVIRWAAHPEYCLDSLGGKDLMDWSSHSTEHPDFQFKRANASEGDSAIYLLIFDRVEGMLQNRGEQVPLSIRPCSENSENQIFDLPKKTTETTEGNSSKDAKESEGNDKAAASGACDLWQQPVLHAKSGVPGSQCFTRVLSSDFESRGQDTACRADTDDSTTNGRGTTTTFKAPSREKCQELCVIAKEIGVCYGFEYMATSHYCELWTVPILHSKPAKSFECSVRMTSDQLVDLYPEPSRVVLHRVDFETNDPKAVCRDGSPPAYYFKPASDPAKKHLWLMLLRGGGWCFTEDNCRNFWAGSSKNWPSTMDKMAIFSTGDDADRINLWRGRGSPLAGANLIYMPYCSSDAHMGDSERAGMQFRGYRITRAALKSLKSMGMKSGDTFVFSGWSAGGRGAMMHLDTVHEAVPDGVRIVGFLDSPLYLEFDGFDRFSSETKQATDLYVADELTKPCEEKWGRKERWKCAFGQYRVPMIKSKFLIVASQNDRYGTTDIARDADKRQTFMKMTRELLRGLGSNAGVHSSGCFDHALSQNWFFNEERVASTRHQLGLTADSDWQAGFTVSMSASLNLTMRAALNGGRLPKIIETCSGFHCGRWCLPIAECESGGEYSDLCTNR